MQITLLTAAREDLKDIWNFGYEQWGEVAADRYFDDLVSAIDTLADHPLMPPVAEGLGRPYRRLVNAAHVVFYLVDGQQIRVVRVLHQTRDVGGWG